ncbi:thiamine transporter 1 isoform X2 [Condylostylus longicornis]|nr:thiamine transporter 1 isoform X2 [Condylostylus longicornis]
MLGLQIIQICYGTFMSAEVAYYTYIYAKVKQEKYQEVTGHTRAAFLIGRFLASVLAQILISYNLMDVRELNYITFGSQIMSLFLALMLPAVKTSIYFYSDKIINDNDNNIHNIENSSTTTVYKQNGENNILPEVIQNKQNEIVKFSWKKATKLLWQHAYTAYTNRTVIQWSIWWSLAMCGYLQVASYVQLLWKDIIDTNSITNINNNNGHNNSYNIVDNNNITIIISHNINSTYSYNGAVEAVLTLLGAVGTFIAGIFNSEHYQKWDLWLLALCSLFEGGFLILAAKTNSIWVAYVMYVLFGVVYFFMITIASATVAKNLAEDSFGLIFGINTLLALAIQSIFTLIVISDKGFSLDCRGQFMSFGIYFIILTILYIIIGGFDEIRLRREKKTSYQTNNL